MNDTDPDLSLLRQENERLKLDRIVADECAEAANHALSVLRASLHELIEAWRAKAADMGDVKPPADWLDGWRPPYQSPENKAYCDGKVRGLRFAADQVADLLARLVSGEQKGTQEQNADARGDTTGNADDSRTATTDK